MRIDVDSSFGVAQSLFTAAGCGYKERFVKDADELASDWREVCRDPDDGMPDADVAQRVKRIVERLSLKQETKQAKAALSKDLNENGANVQMLFEHLTGAGA